MKSLRIEGSRATPTIDFNAKTNELSITGESYPENASIFYNDAMEWLKEYLSDHNKKITFNLKLTYFNTSSSKIITDILEMIQAYNDNGGEIILNWYFEDDDEDSKDDGEIFLEYHSFPFKLIPFSE